MSWGCGSSVTLPSRETINLLFMLIFNGLDNEDRMLVFQHMLRPTPIPAKEKHFPAPAVPDFIALNGPRDPDVDLGITPN